MAALLTSAAHAGEIRIGAGLTEVNDGPDFTTFELGYDINRTWGISVGISDEDSKWDVQRTTAMVELGHTFGDTLQVKPYISAGARNLSFNDDDQTDFAYGLGLRASFLFAYADLSLIKSENISNVYDDEAVSFTVGLQF